MTPTIDLARDLIRRPSVTPDDAGCQELIAGRLSALGFSTERLRFGEVDNLWAWHGQGGPLLVLLGHTDVVPPGPEVSWRHPPFAATVADGLLHGRGAADMKGSLAAMVVAAERFVAEHPDHPGRIAFLVTSDEEGPARNGTRRVVDWLMDRGESIDWCLVGEPSSSRKVGDTVKNGRRGSIGGTLIVEGIQGHVAYPELARNPIHDFAPVLAELTARDWDQGNDFFPPTSFQVSNIQAGTEADNVIPGRLEVRFNFRYSTETTAEALREVVETACRQAGLEHAIEWHHSGLPFLTAGGPLLAATEEAIEAVTGRRPELSTAGGTSDGRFVAPTGAQVVELGPVNATIHKVDECVSVEDLERLTEIYHRILRRLLTTD